MKNINVVAAIIIKNNKIFITQRGYGEFKDYWEFPGGKIENGETKEEALIREIKEETNLDIKNIKLCAIKEWRFEDNIRYIGFLYKTNKFKGTLKSSNEGNVFFIKESEINNYKLSQDFIELYNLMKNN
mgnify:CR=1 FL=1